MIPPRNDRLSGGIAVGCTNLKARTGSARHVSLHRLPHFRAQKESTRAYRSVDIPSPAPTETARKCQIFLRPSDRWPSVTLLTIPCYR